MCGIAGYYSPKGVKQSLLEQMGRMLEHRGPDDFGIYSNGSMGLVHTRLSIIDLNSGHQPLISSCGKHALVVNGEIYNYVELRRELKKKGCHFKTNSDSETILNSYKIDKENFIEQLYGMFAFALFDSEENKLILARDRLGIKPLYYIKHADKIAFASEIKALLPILQEKTEINPHSLVQYLQRTYISGTNTLFKGIMRVQPGEALSITPPLHVNAKKYWSLNLNNVSLGYNEAKNVYDELIERVMTEHVRSDVPYGLFLSGGTDSAILLSELVKYQGKPIRTFSIGYEETMERNELIGAERIAKLFKTDHTSFLVTQDQLLKRIPFVVWANDDLMQDYANIPTSILAEEASKELKVVFTGEGGDEVFAGYKKYQKPVLKQFLNSLLLPSYRGIKINRRWSKKVTNDVFGPKIKHLESSFRIPFKKTLQSLPSGWSYLQYAQANDILGELLNRLLVKVDRMLMAFGLEGRVPYLDHRLVTFGLSLPDSLKIDGKDGKFFLKRWARNKIPTDHLNQKKRGFHMPAAKIFNDTFLDQLENKLINNRAIQSLFQIDGIRKIFYHHRLGVAHVGEIWAIMQIAIWHFLFIEHPNRKPSPEEHPLDWIS